MIGRGDPFYLKFWVKLAALGEIADFLSIFARIASVVTRSEKCSIVTNSKSTTDRDRRQTDGRVMTYDEHMYNSDI